MLPVSTSPVLLIATQAVAAEQPELPPLRSRGHRDSDLRLVRGPRKSSRIDRTVITEYRPGPTYALGYN